MATDHVSLSGATRAWFRVALQTFGGPAGQIAVMHREFVDERRWIGERRFLHALSYCTLLPGPEAQQLAIYLGWLLNGTAGGLVAGVLFVLPGYLAIMALSFAYAGWGDTLAIEALFAGVAPAVLAVVAHAVVRVAKRALGDPSLIAIAVAAFAALAFLAVPFPFVIAAAGVAGLLIGRRKPDGFRSGEGAVDPDAPPPVIPDDTLHVEPRSWRRAAMIVGVGGLLWAAPVVAVAIAFGRSSVFVDEGLFFGGTALVTFGGAYAVLGFVADRAVETYGWLSPHDMITGLAMAESTPGPLIMVVQFVGFMGAYNMPGDLNPWVAACVAATLVTWVTFVPCFVFIYVGAPYVEALRDNRRLADALTGITAAVVGVIANLAVYFGRNVLDEWESVVVAALGGVLLFGARWSVLRTLGVCAMVGGALHIILS